MQYLPNQIRKHSTMSCSLPSLQIKKRSFSAHKPDAMQTARQFEQEQDDKDEQAPNVDSAEPSYTY
uniref:Uncharacterized protein n=1 Tax=Echinococcus canadensis TaxID=519352 RepID=A0A915ESU5_9CEST